MALESTPFAASGWGLRCQRLLASREGTPEGPAETPGELGFVLILEHWLSALIPQESCSTRQGGGGGGGSKASGQNRQVEMHQQWEPQKGS